MRRGRPRSRSGAPGRSSESSASDHACVVIYNRIACPRPKRILHKPDRGGSGHEGSRPRQTIDSTRSHIISHSSDTILSLTHVRLVIGPRRFSSTVPEHWEEHYVRDVIMHAYRVESSDFQGLVRKTEVWTDDEVLFFFWLSFNR